MKDDIKLHMTNCQFKSVGANGDFEVEIRGYNSLSNFKTITFTCSNYLTRLFARVVVGQINGRRKILQEHIDYTQEILDELGPK